jgi:hypothetical protein
LKPYVARTTPKIKVPPPKVPEINLEEAEIPVKFILSGLKGYQIIRELKKMQKEAEQKGEGEALPPLSEAAKLLLNTEEKPKRRMSFNPYKKLPPRYWLPPEERKAYLESRKKKKKKKEQQTNQTEDTKSETKEKTTTSEISTADNNTSTTSSSSSSSTSISSTTTTPLVSTTDTSQ